MVLANISLVVGKESMQGVDNEVKYEVSYVPVVPCGSTNQLQYRYTAADMTSAFEHSSASRRSCSMPCAILRLAGLALRVK
jgi:hypothetical protein